MIQTILILLLIHYIGLFIFKPKHNTLNCGLFGWSGKDTRKFNKDKFDKLGMLNVERGKSSCGISFDGDIQIGTDSTKFYYDFIVDREIKPKRFPVVIGHTRQASNGTVNVYNAHPFGFGDNENDFIFIGAHNGTLKNHKELAKKYEIEESVENSYFDKFDKEITIKRDKIDSELLLEIIYTHKNFKVLSEYIGGAALTFTDTTNPNILYLFKGKSKDWPSSSHETTERPLFVYIENKNSMYYSSLEESLRTIGGNDYNIIDIEPNTVYKITDGDFKNAIMIPITRINASQNPSYLNTKNTNVYGPNYGMYGFDDEYYVEKYGTAFIETKKETKEEKSNTLITLPAAKTVIKEKEVEKIKDKPLNIYEESLLKPHDEYHGIPYFHKLRWWRNGQPITGIFTYIFEYGYYYVGDTEKAANERFYQILDCVFDGKIFYDNDAFTKGKIPFQSSRLVEPPLYYFVQGVQIKTYLDYAFFHNKFKALSPGNYLDAIELSNVSTHPIINLNFATRELVNQNIVKDGKVYTGKTTLLGAEKIYHIEKGNLINLEINSFYSNILDSSYYSTKKEESSEIKLSNESTLFKDIDFEEIKEQNDDDLLEEMIAKEKETTQIVRDICEEDFTEPIKDFQQVRNKMFKYSENPLAIKVISFIDNTSREMKEFIN